MKNKNIKNKAEQEFYQFPKLLLKGEKYKNTLTANDRQAYVVLNDRLSVSIKNEWFDENGDIYFIYSNNSLAEILNVSKPTVIKIKKNLSRVGLLKEVRTGRANKLYLQVPEAIDEEEEKYIITYEDELMTEEQSHYISENVEESNEEPVKHVNTFDENNPYEDHESLTELTNLSTDIKNVYPSNKNLTIPKDFKENKESEYELQNNQLKHAFQNNQTQDTEDELIDMYTESYALNDLFGEQIITLMKTYSFSDFSQFELFTDKLIHSHRSVEKERGKTYLTIENEGLHSELYKGFNRVIIGEKKGKVKNVNNYLFMTLKNIFENFADQKDFEDTYDNDESEKPVSINNWIEEESNVDEAEESLQSMV